MSNSLWEKPIYIREHKIKNRIVFPPITTNWADSEGNVTEKILGFYEEIAKGGCGIIIVEGTVISKEGKSSTNCLGLYNQENIFGLELLARIIKENKCFASLQLTHAGGQANPNFTGYEPIAPSVYECNSTKATAREMFTDEIENIKEKFIFAGKSAEKIGFDAVELHLAHGYLLHEFLSKHFNKRKDEYGGNLENRMRIIGEIIKGIKKNSNIIIGARISGEDYLENGINYDVNKKILPLLEKEGIEYFSVSAGIYETSKLKHTAMKRGEFFNYSRKIKKIVNKPVIGVGKILDLESAEEHLIKEDCDLVAIGRGMIADPYMIKKTIEGIKFNRCTECNQCSFLRFGKQNLSCKIRGI